jgi:hypothetical protein
VLAEKPDDFFCYGRSTRLRASVPSYNIAALSMRLRGQNCAYTKQAHITRFMNVLIS